MFVPWSISPLRCALVGIVIIVASLLSAVSRADRWRPGRGLSRSAPRLGRPGSVSPTSTRLAGPANTRDARARARFVQRRGHDRDIVGSRAQRLVWRMVGRAPSSPAALMSVPAWALLTCRPRQPRSSVRARLDRPVMLRTAIRSRASRRALASRSRLETGRRRRPAAGRRAGDGSSRSERTGPGTHRREVGHAVVGSSSSAPCSVRSSAGSASPRSRAFVTASACAATTSPLYALGLAFSGFAAAERRWQWLPSPRSPRASW